VAVEVACDSCGEAWECIGWEGERGDGSSVVWCCGDGRSELRLSCVVRDECLVDVDEKEGMDVTDDRRLLLVGSGRSMELISFATNPCCGTLPINPLLSSITPTFENPA